MLVRISPAMRMRSKLMASSSSSNLLGLPSRAKVRSLIATAASASASIKSSCALANQKRERQTMERDGGVVVWKLSVRLVAATGVEPRCELLQRDEAIVAQVLGELLQPLNRDAVDSAHDLDARAVVPHLQKNLTNSQPHTQHVGLHTEGKKGSPTTATARKCPITLARCLGESAVRI